MKRSRMMQIPRVTMLLLLGATLSIGMLIQTPEMLEIITFPTFATPVEAAQRSSDIWGDFDTDDDKPKPPPKPLLYQQTNFPEMRREVEKLFDTVVTSTGGSGPLFTRQVNHWEKGGYDEPSQSVNFAEFIGTKYSQLYLGKYGMATKLAEVAKLSFKDITGTEWYAGQIPLAVYYGMVNGYEDGTFRGGQAVSRAEFATMYANALSVEPNPKAVQNIYGNTWYVGNLHVIKGSVAPEHMNKTTINQGMTRGEVAMTLASLYNMGGISKYEDMIQAGTLKDYKFSDIKGTTSSVGLDMAQNKYGEDGVYNAYMQKCKNPSKPPTDVLVAMLALNDIGVMVGDSNKNSNWTQPVTRAEVITLFNKAELSAKGLTRK